MEQQMTKQQAIMLLSVMQGYLMRDNTPFSTNLSNQINDIKILIGDEQPVSEAPTPLKK